MKKEFKEIIIFFIIYTSILLLFIAARDIIILNIKSLYYNIFIFIIIISFSQMIIFDNLENENNCTSLDYFKNLLKKTICINVSMIFLMGIINIVLFLMYNLTINVGELLYISIQLFLILTISSILTSLLNKNFLLLSVFIFIYYIEASYGSYFTSFGFYYCYLQEVSFIINLGHYIFWIAIVLLIIYLKYIRKRGNQYVRIRKYK